MSEALAVYTPEVEQQSLTISRPPERVLEEAQKAAAALAKVINGKAKPVRFNGETYLEFEDWQTIARFYGLSTRIISTTPVTFGDVHGWEAKAEAISNANGQVVSAADSMCLNDEANWKSKPMFMLRSMAQTRACAKALRNVLAWVVVLAGYKPTPAEEMDGVQGFSYNRNGAADTPKKKTGATAAKATSTTDPNDVVWNAMREAGVKGDEVKAYSINILDKERSSDWNDDDRAKIVAWLSDYAAHKAAQSAEVA